MDDLKRRFGRLLAVHRRRLGMTQGELAVAAAVSVDMISKLETGTSGARFSVIERLAKALKIDPAELFSTDLKNGIFQRNPSFAGLTAQLAELNDADLIWIKGMIDATVKNRR